MIAATTGLACVLAYALGALDGKFRLSGAVLAAVAGIMGILLAGTLIGIQ